jgi:hypothetical protein
MDVRIWTPGRSTVRTPARALRGEPSQKARRVAGSRCRDATLGGAVKKPAFASTGKQYLRGRNGEKDEEAARACTSRRVAGRFGLSASVGVRERVTAGQASGEPNVQIRVVAPVNAVRDSANKLLRPLSDWINRCQARACVLASRVQIQTPVGPGSPFADLAVTWRPVSRSVTGARRHQGPATSSFDEGPRGDRLAAWKHRPVRSNSEAKCPSGSGAVCEPVASGAVCLPWKFQVELVSAWTVPVVEDEITRTEHTRHSSCVQDVRNDAQDRTVCTACLVSEQRDTRRQP